MQIKAFEHERLSQIRDDVRFDDLVNKMVLVSGSTISVKDTLFINDRNFKIFEILNEKEEQTLKTKIDSISFENAKECFDFLFNESNFKHQRIFEEEEMNNDEDPDTELNEIVFENLRK
jgi:hypothetical protein